MQIHNGLDPKPNKGFFLSQNIVMILKRPSRRDRDYFSYKDGKGGGFLSGLTAMSNYVQAREMKSCSD